jgi:hypothetical protein
MGRGDVPDAFIDRNGFVNVATASNGDPAVPNVYNNGLLSKSLSVLPPLSAGGFKLFSVNTLHSNHLIQTGIHDLFTLEGYVQDTLGVWQQIGSYQPFKKVATEPWSTGGTVDILSDNGSYLIGTRSGAGIGTICKIKYGESQVSAVVSHIPILKIKNYMPGQKLDWSSIETPSAKLAVSTIENSQLKVTFPTITNFQPNINYRNYTCKDINNDGLEDIVVNPILTYPNFNQEANPIVYIAKKDGSFAKASFSPLLYTISRPSHTNQVSSLLGDFDGDKLPDIVMFGHDIGYGNLPSLYETIQFFKANKKIE